MVLKKLRILCVALSCVVASSAAALAAVGTAVDVSPGATVTTAQGTVELRPGMEINQGDVIRTNSRGQAQLVFFDETKIAVGPNSSLSVDDVVRRSNSRANRFAVSAVSGTFRFISGKSAKGAYKIGTPTATMGIRGTVFDFTVDRRRETVLALLSGEVDMCGAGNRCKTVAGSCSMAWTERGRGVTEPERDEVGQTLRRDFPFVMGQERLREEFRANLEGCEDHFALRVLKPNAPPTVVPAAQPAPPPPAPEPEPEPEAEPDGGFPGNSGETGPSEGQGNNVSDGQSGEGTGKGQGGGKK